MEIGESAVDETAVMLPVVSPDGVPVERAPGDGGAIWMTPWMTLWTLSAVNFLLYFDRGAVAGALSSIRSDPHLTEHGGALSDAKSGLLVSGFTIGYVFASPFFAARGVVWGSRTIILFGMVLWCGTCLSCAFAMSYAALLFLRILVGVSEAAFVGFTVTIIDNIAPAARRTSWMGYFYSMISVGTALGIAAGGILTSHGTFQGYAPWRLIFVAEVFAALPVVALLYILPHRYHLPPAQEDDADSCVSFVAATRQVLSNLNYVLLVLGYSTYCFVTGAISTWGIPLLHEGPLGLSKSTAAVVLGVSTTLSGVVGSLFGGFVVDCFGGGSRTTGAVHCQLFNIAMILLAIPCGVIALLTTSLTVFGVCFVIAVIAIFAITAPVNAALLTLVPNHLRPYAVSYSVFVIHLLGDFPSPTLAGAVSDHLGRRCHNLTADSCAALSQEKDCKWIVEPDASARCIFRLQLRNALLLVFAYLFLAPLAWTPVWWRLREATKAGSVTVEDAVGPSLSVSPANAITDTSHKRD